MKNEMRFISPIDGDMLNERDGVVVGDQLVVSVTVSAETGHEISINGKTAVYREGFYTAEVYLGGYSNNIVAFDKTTGSKDAIIIYKLNNITGKYRLSLDDNIWFLQDIAKNANNYKSIFDNPFLSLHKETYKEFGTKVHINIYYQTDGFNISEMPSKYKEEWKDNSDWLRLSFHALANEPDSPYLNSSYDEMKQDCEKVREQIIRFAGEEVMGPVTTLHWGDATVEGCRALRDQGYKCQVADFRVETNCSPVSYYLNMEQRRHMYKRFIWKDNKEDIIFFRSAIIIDTHKLEHIPGFLDEIYADPHQSCYMDLLIHEQYFYPHYIDYQKDYRDKIRTAVKWAVEKGYKSEFLERCVF